MASEIILLGTKGGPAIRTGGPSPTASLLIVEGRIYVIDCGLGVTRGFVEAGLGLKALSTIFITHHHSDHNLEFGNLIHTAWTTGLSTPVAAYGASGLRQMWTDFCRLNAYDITTRIADEGRPALEPMVTACDFTEGLVMEDDLVRVEALRNHHPPVTESFALKFSILAGSARGKSVVFSGDTAFILAMVDFAADADVLVHEVMLLEGVDRLVAKTGNGARLKAHLLASHTTTEELARLATAARVKCLALNHLVPADDPAITEETWREAIRSGENGQGYAGELVVGRDGLRIPVG